MEMFKSYFDLPWGWVESRTGDIYLNYQYGVKNIRVTDISQGEKKD